MDSIYDVDDLRAKLVGQYEPTPFEQPDDGSEPEIEYLRRTR